MDEAIPNIALKRYTINIKICKIYAYNFALWCTLINAIKSANDIMPFSKSLKVTSPRY